MMKENNEKGKIEDLNSANCSDGNELNIAFEKFNYSSQRLASLYSQLKTKVETVDKEMEEKNEELNKRINESHRVSQYLNSILESMHSGVIAVDLEGNITTLNRAAKNILCYQADDAVGKSCDTILNSLEKGKSLLRKAIDRKKDLLNFKRKVLRSDNREIWIESSVTLLRENDGSVVGAVEVFKDLTEIISLENKLEQVGDLASIGEMTASIAHEIRNPLNGIKGFASLLEDGFKKEDPRKRFVNHIVKGVDNLNNMVTDLLVLAKPITPSLEKNDIGEIMSEVITFAREDLKVNGSKIDIKTDYDNKPILLNCDRYMLYQVFFNIIKNSFQSMPSDGTVMVGINSREINGKNNGKRKVEVSISDNGVGINKDAQSRIFEPFFTTKSKGTGLGLSLVQKIVKLHNGQIQLESAPGRGTTFRVYLPKLNGNSN